MISTIVKCAWCGKEFEKYRKRQVYCSADCRKSANAEYARIRARKKREEKEKAGSTTEKPRNKVDNLQTKIEKAKKAGISYGKYIASQNLPRVKID